MPEHNTDAVWQFMSDELQFVERKLQADEAYRTSNCVTSPKHIPEFGEGTPGADYVIRPGGYLVVRNSRNKFAVVSTPRGFFLPGGGQEESETAAQAAVREANEECGLIVTLGELLGTADELVFASAEEQYFRKRCVFFSAELVSWTGGGESDHDLIWMSADEAATRLTHKSQAWAVKLAQHLSADYADHTDC